MRPLAGQGGVLFGVLRIAHIHHAKYCGTPTVREQYTAVLHQFLLFASSLFVRGMCDMYASRIPVGPRPWLLACAIEPIFYVLYLRGAPSHASGRVNYMWCIVSMAMRGKPMVLLQTRGQYLAAPWYLFACLW